MSEIQEIERRLRRLKGVRRAEVAGSVRRRKETIGDADILVISDNPKPVMNYFKIPGTSRASFSIYNTKEEVDKLVIGINEVLQIFK